MDLLHHIWATLRHMDAASVGDLASYMGPWLYVLLFGIVFCETGLVVTPLLPGDSLLFTVGAVAATAGSGVNLWFAIVLLCVAANCGDLLNYALGYHLGPRVFRVDASQSRFPWSLLNRKHLDEAQRFYDRHGRKTIILARFVPVIRTFAPFVAGVGRMRFVRFIGFSVSGGILWVVLLTGAGYSFGHNAFVQKHYEMVIMAIVVISLVPMIVQVIASRRDTPPRGFQSLGANEKDRGSRV
jgi:membrane-associated protein